MGFLSQLLIYKIEWLKIKMDETPRRRTNPQSADVLEPIEFAEPKSWHLNEDEYDFDDIPGEILGRDPLEPEMTSVEKRIEDVRDEVAAVSKLVSKMQTQVDQLLKNLGMFFEPVHKKLDNLDRRLTSVEQQVASVVALGVAMQTGTEPIMPVPKAPTEIVVINQVLP